MSLSPMFIVENHQKAETLAAQLGEGVETLLVNTLPFQVSSVMTDGGLGQYDFVPQPQAKEFIENLHKSFNREIILALDGDQRGDYWSWLIAGYIAVQTRGANTPRRMILPFLEGVGLAASIKSLVPVNEKKAQTNYVRSTFNSYLSSHFKRLLGTSIGPGNLPLTYHSLTTLFLLADREVEISMYSPVLRWQIKAEFAVGESQYPFRLEQVRNISEDGFLDNAELARDTITGLSGNQFVVSNVEKSQYVLQPVAPLRFADILQEGFVRYQLNPKQVLDILRTLYHGISINGKKQGLITSFIPVPEYDFTPVVETLQNYIIDQYGDDQLAEEDDILAITGEHILPVNPEIESESLKQVLNREECQLYELIRARAIASQMVAAEGENMEIEIKGGDDYLFRASGRNIFTPGFLAAYQSVRDKELLQPSPLLKLVKGQSIDLIKTIPEQTTGFPPEYYSFENLFIDLADFSMEIDPLSIAMIQTMLDSDYIYFTPEGCLRPKANTIKVINTINRAFPTMKGVNLSAYLEQTMAEVESGRKEFGFALQQFDQTLLKQGKVLVKLSLAELQKRRARGSSSIIKTSDEQAAQPKMPAEKPYSVKERGKEDTVESSDIGAAEVAEREEQVSVPPVTEEQPETIESEEVAEQSGEDTVETTLEPGVEASSELLGIEEKPTEEVGAKSDGNEDLAVSQGGVEDDMAAAEEVFNVEPEMEEAEVTCEMSVAPSAGDERVETKPCPLCSRSMILKSDKFGKYWSCTGFPTCRHAEPYEQKAESQAMDCPLCDSGKIQVKLTPIGKQLFVCIEAGCEFMAWSQPHMMPCQNCASPYLVEKKNLKGKSYLRCPRAGCNYMQPMPGDDGADVAASENTAATPKKKKVRVRRKTGGGTVAAAGKRKVRVVRRKK